MVVTRRTVAWILGVTALVGTCSNGFAEKNATCAATCMDNYERERHSCPSLTGDGAAYFWCIEKSQNRQEVCVSACPNASTSTNGNTIGR